MQRNLTISVFLLPTLVFVVLFIAFPMLYSGYLSLTKFNYATDTQPTFIGLKGYINTILHDPFFHIALLNQIRFAIPYFILSFLFSLAVAILLNELKQEVQLFQTIFYLPMIIPLSFAGIIFAWILAPDFGIFNNFLRILGIENWNIDWFGNPHTAIYAMVIAQSWKMVGFTIIVFLAGLQSIPEYLREAARVDGANFWQEIFFVVLPNLKPYLLTGGIWILINSMKVFDLPAAITGGGPGTATLTLYYYSWKLAFQRLDMGKASQVAYITAFIILLLSWLWNKMLKPNVAERR